MQNGECKLQSAKVTAEQFKNFHSALFVFPFEFLLAPSYPPDCRRIILLAENRRTCDKDISARVGDLYRILGLHSAIYLDLDLQAQFVDPLPELPNLVN